MSQRTILHNADAAPGLLVAHEVAAITGLAVREDKGAVTLRLATAAGDRLLMGMSAAMLDAMIDVLKRARAELDDGGPERTIEPLPIHTAQCGVLDVEGVSYVSLIFDRSLASAAAYLMPPANARIVARQLTTTAQMASSRRGVDEVH